MHKLDSIFSVLAAKYSSFARFSNSITQHDFNYTCTYTSACVVLYLVIIEAMKGMSSETIEEIFYKYKILDNRLLWNKAQGDKKDHVLKEMTWNNIRKSV